MEANICTVDISLTIGGSPYAVDSAKLVTAVNAIPQISLSVWPMGSGINVKKPSIEDYDKIYRDLCERAEKLNVECDIDIVVTVNGSDGEKDVQRVHLKDWILSGAGMSQVSATAAPYVTVVIQHPICKLTKLGYIYETPNSMFYLYMQPDDNGFAEIADYVYDFYAVASDDQFLDTMDEGEGHAKMYRTELNNPENLPTTYLEDFTSLFLGSEITAHDAMRRAEADIAKPSEDGVVSCTWEMILRACGTLLLTVSQDQEYNYTTEKLKLEPLRPWMDPEIEFFEKDCAWVELPGMDPLKLTGVMVDLTSGGEDVINHGMYANPSADEQRRCAFYSPIADPTPDSIGRIIKVGRPAALVGMYSYDSAFQSEEEGSTTKTEDRTDGDPEKKYAYAVYYCTARSMVKTAAEFRLMFRSGGNLIVPGVSCTFNSKEGVVYYGYITSVTHNLTTSGQCTTTVNYSYVRSEKDYPGISVPMENPAYE